MFSIEPIVLHCSTCHVLAVPYRMAVQSQCTLCWQHYHAPVGVHLHMCHVRPVPRVVAAYLPTHHGLSVCSVLLCHTSQHTFGQDVSCSKHRLGLRRYLHVCPTQWDPHVTCGCRTHWLFVSSKQLHRVADGVQMLTISVLST